LEIVATSVPSLSVQHQRTVDELNDGTGAKAVSTMRDEAHTLWSRLAPLIAMSNRREVVDIDDKVFWPLIDEAPVREPQPA
jgi:hypothetical protein